MTEVISSTIVWEGSSWRLREERLRLADGSIYAKGIVDHPGSVVLIPYQDNQVFMIRQYRLALKQTILELPAGTRTPDEPWLVCAQRELREEVGHRAETFTALGRLWPAPGFSNEEMTIYLATGLTPAPLPQDPDEEIEVTPMPLADLLPMVRDGRIQDAKTVIGILKVAEYLGR
ncbi:MAG: NUDIX hydrolase [Candidatus Promineifilaceae bacterium]